MGLVRKGKRAEMQKVSNSQIFVHDVYPPTMELHHGIAMESKPFNNHCLSIDYLSMPMRRYEMNSFKNTRMSKNTIYR